MITIKQKFAFTLPIKGQGIVFGRKETPAINESTPSKSIYLDWLNCNWYRVFIMAMFLLVYGVSEGNDKRLPLLKVSDDKHFLTLDNDEPFFWLGDTAWELLHKLNREETMLYLKDRAAKGFNVIQTVVLAELDGLNIPNANGDLPLLNNDPTKPNERYFDHVDWVIKQANDLGIYIALLPTWGDKFNKKWGIGPEIFTPENAEVYGEFLARRYLNESNLVWVLGGDRIPENDLHYNIIRSMARGIRKVDSRHLITYHISGGKRSTEYVNENWLDIDMFQTGHNKNSQDYDFVWEARETKPARPAINSEPRYENIPNNLKDPAVHGWINDSDVRKSAYWTILAGAAGFTYGCNDIWQMFKDGNNPVIYARTDWSEAIHLMGSRHMMFMKNFFSSFHWQEMENNQDIILNENQKGQEYMMASVSREKDIMLIYTPVGNMIQPDLSVMPGGKLKAFWQNPRDGKIKFISEFINTDRPALEPSSRGEGSDYVLIIVHEKVAGNFM